ncbi:hypothetical protein LJB81_02720 [Desulfovibrio sp. OttesenSCG-928-M14]|nr:hypothetical protein [Desulfovibrio sp. OttesenSCG-928-M14]
MYAPLPAALRPAKVLFLCNGEASVRNDVRLLRALGVNDIIFSEDPQKALALLEDEALRLGRGELSTRERLDLVVCDERIQGLPVAVFLHALAGRPALRIKPVLVLAASADLTESLSRAGVLSLARPYAEQDLRVAAQKAMSPMRRVLRQEDTVQLRGVTPLPEKARPAPAKTPLTTSDRYQQGLALLKEGDFENAGKAFAQVLTRNEDHVGAALGLAKTCQATNDIKGMQCYLLRAAAACLRNDERERAEAIAAMLPRGMRDKIFMHEAVVRMEQGEYREAALGFLDATKEAQSQPLHSVIARACLLSERPDQDMGRLCEAFAGLGHDRTARHLKRRLLDYEPYAASVAASWLDRFPLLRDIVGVASQTALAWRSH